MSVRMSSLQFMYNYKNSLNDLYKQQAKLFEQADGSTIHRGSDDPVGYSKLLRYNTTGNETGQYKKDVDNALSWMRTSDNAISHLADIMKTFDTKTVEAATDLNTDPDFQAIAKEMMTHIQEIVSLGNTQQGDRYIFAGQKDTTEPFTLSEQEYSRGLAKTLDDKQAEFFKGTAGDINSKLYQMLTLESTDPQTKEVSTYYLDTQSGYVYSKDFVDEGYKEIIAKGYNTIDDVINNTPSNAIEVVNFAECVEGMYVIPESDKTPMTIDEAQAIVNDAISTDITKFEEDLKKIVQADDINKLAKEDSDIDENLIKALKRISMDNDVTSNLDEEVEQAQQNIIDQLTDTTTANVSWSRYTGSTKTVTEDVWNSGEGKKHLTEDIQSAIRENMDGHYLSTTTVSNVAQTILDTVDPSAVLPASFTSDTSLTTYTLPPTATGVDQYSMLNAISNASKACKSYVDFDVSSKFTNQGTIKVGETSAVSISMFQKETYYIGEDGSEVAIGDMKPDESYTVRTRFSYDANGKIETDDLPSSRFKMLKQRLVTYNGDPNYISMVKMNGSTDPRSDTVNVTGQDMYGSDIFDNELSGNEQSGSAMLNNMLTVYTKTNSPDPHWLISDGITLSDVSHATMTIAETTLGSQMELYTSVSTMLDRRSDDITEDITNLSGTDIAYLATKLMEMTALYNMSLSLGGRILPQSLADYL